MGISVDARRLRDRAVLRQGRAGRSHLPRRRPCLEEEEKKTNKIPKKGLDTARRRLRECESRNTEATDRAPRLGDQPTSAPADRVRHRYRFRPIGWNQAGDGREGLFAWRRASLVGLSLPRTMRWSTSWTFGSRKSRTATPALPVRWKTPIAGPPSSTIWFGCAYLRTTPGPF